MYDKGILKTKQLLTGIGSMYKRKNKIIQITD